MTRLVSCSEYVTASSLEFFSGMGPISISPRPVVESLVARYVVRGRVSVSVRKRTVFLTDVLVVTATAYAEED